MKQLFVLLCVSIYVLGLEISFNKEFAKQITPDKLSTYITITVNKEEEIEISPILNKFNKYITSIDEVEKIGGNFSISPKYKYNKGNSIIIGYNGSLRYQIYSQNPKTINSFIKKLLNLKDDSDVSISVASLNWIVSKSKYSQIIDELRLKSIIWSKQYAIKLSHEMSAVCKVKAVNINSTNFIPLYRQQASTYRVSNSMPSDIPVPKATKNTISLKPTYLLECK